MPTIDIAENSSSIFIHLDKSMLINAKIREAFDTLKEFLSAESALPPLDFSNIPIMSDEEQAEIEETLDAMTDEDKEIGFVSRIYI